MNVIETTVANFSTGVANIATPVANIATPQWQNLLPNNNSTTHTLKESMTVKEEMASEVKHPQGGEGTE